jgi:hypothetical protein
MEKTQEDEFFEKRTLRRILVFRNEGEEATGR